MNGQPLPVSTERLRLATPPKLGYKLNAKGHPPPVIASLERAAPTLEDKAIQWFAGSSDVKGSSPSLAA